jgi:fumarate reductase subunit D
MGQRLWSIRGDGFDTRGDWPARGNVRVVGPEGQISQYFELDRFSGFITNGGTCGDRRNSRMMRPHRGQSLWIAFVMHRISGLALAIFLPFHFYLLGLALNNAETMDGLLQWSEFPIVKFAEFGLVFLLALHLFGGLRLLALEFLPWNNRQKTLAAIALAGSFLVACSFLLRAI